MASKHASQHRPVSTVCLLVCALTGLGCGDEPAGPPRAAVEGTVTIGGTELSRGLIRFRPTDPTAGPLAIGEVASGTFSIAAEVGPVIGSHSIEVESLDNGGFEMDDEAALEELHAMRKPPKIRVMTVPAKYHKQSPLTADVTESGPNTFHFDLDPKTR